MFQAQFESKLNQSNLHIYLDKSYEEDYQIPMLQKNPIVGILPVRGAALDGRSKYTYQTKGFQTMAVIYEKKPIQQQEIQLLVMELLQIIEKLENYMLNPNCLILDPEYIFLNEKQWYFCYLPGWNGKLSQSFHQLTEYFVRTLDYGDTNGIVLAYELHKATLQENYNLGEIMKQYEAHEEERKRTMEEWREEQRQNRNRLMFGEQAEGVQMRIAEDYGNVFRLTEEEEQYDPEDTKGYYEVEEGMQAIREEGGTWKSWRKAAKRLKRNRWGSWNDFILEGDEDSDSM